MNAIREASSQLLPNRVPFRGLGPQHILGDKMPPITVLCLERDSLPHSGVQVTYTLFL